MKINFVEVKRKLWHIAWGVLFYFIILFHQDKWGYQLTIGCFIFAGIVILLLRKKGIKIGWVDYLIKKIGRKGEGIEACFYYVLSIFISSLFFEQNIVALSALVLGVCDGVATIFGVHGKNRIYKKKTLEGSGAFFISCFLIVYFSGFGKLAALITSAALSLIELFTEVNDNLIIPPAFSIIISLLA